MSRAIRLKGAAHESLVMELAIFPPLRAPPPPRNPTQMLQALRRPSTIRVLDLAPLPCLSVACSQGTEDCPGTTFPPVSLEPLCCARYKFLGRQGPPCRDQRFSPVAGVSKPGLAGPAPARYARRAGEMAPPRECEPEGGEPRVQHAGFLTLKTQHGLRRGSLELETSF